MLDRRILAIPALALLALGLLAAGCGGGVDDVAAPPAPVEEAPAPGEPPAPAAAPAEQPATPPAGEPDPAPVPAEPGDATPPVPTEPAPDVPEPTGGIVRAEWEAAFGFTNNLDPTGEYLGEAFMLYNALVRTLVGYRHAPGAAGNELIPDLAQALPEVSADGLTYTLRLRDGIRFGPPASREITSTDIAYAFERIGTEALAAQYGFYYVDTIAGMRDFFEGNADSISGIATPDDKTIVFTLTEPVGDFVFRLSMPATAPIPREVASCFPNPGDYGRFLVASGPYMLAGSDELDLAAFEDCDTSKPLAGLEPISGYRPDQTIELVRNPDYDPATDEPGARPSLVDGFHFAVNTNTDDIFDKVKAGELDFQLATETPKVLREYSTSDELADRLKVNSGDRLWYLTLNVTQPPFDDVHVRRAVNLVMDKEGLRQAYGGPINGEIATHIVPDPILLDELEGYDPYPSEGSTGDVEAAKEEMRQSRYDTDGDGICDAPACSDVLNVADTRGVDNLMAPVIEESLAKIGIGVVTRHTANAYLTIQTVSKNVPMSSRPGWGKDYADASTFFDALFVGANIIPKGNSNFPLVGITPEIAGAIQGFEGNLEGVPSVDAEIAACRPLAGDERVACYAALDRKLMEEVVPWVPYLASNTIEVLGEAVTHYQFDQFAANASLVHMGLDPSKQ